LSAPLLAKTRLTASWSAASTLAQNTPDSRTFGKLVDVLARTMGDVFPEIRAKQKHVAEVLQREEEAFNKTLDKGIALFEAEVARLSKNPTGSARFQRADAGFQPESIGTKYTKRRLPHYERPHGIYHVTFSTHERRELSPTARSLVIDSVRHFDGQRYDLFAVCVMPDHVHVLFQPSIKETSADESAVFWSLTELLHSIKSYTANEINRVEETPAISVWEKESFDTLMRGDRQLEEAFSYICRNPLEAGLTDSEGSYPWLWTWDPADQKGAPQDAKPVTLEACAPAIISGSFAFRLYDEQGFPLDLTELMARERGLTVDVAGFEKLMEEQRARARAAQKKEIITVSDDNLQVAPTQFLGYDFLETEAVVEAITPTKNPGEFNVVLDRTACYAEMGGQVGDTGLLHVPGHDRCEVGRLAVQNTLKKGDVFLHRATLSGGRAPEPGEAIRVAVDAGRRAAIQRHHTVTHLLHWALHEVVSREATQKGSFVGPDKLTFDFNSAALTPAQVRDIEKLVNERIVENATVTWTEMPYAEVKSHAGIMQFFGDKYGDTVRVVQIGGRAGSLDGYSMELCGGTHTRATGEIGLFRIVSEAAIAAGVRRIEAVAGLEASSHAVRDAERLLTIAAQLNSPVGEIEKKIEVLLANHKELEKALKAARAREAAARAKDLVSRAEPVAGIPFLAVDLGPVDGDYLQAVADALKGNFSGVCLLAGTANSAVALVASVSPEFTSRVQAGKLIQAVAPIVGGKGGGKPDAARGGGKDPSKLADALAHARTLLQ
jgi:alanyl-tRNA synthetase